MVHGGHIAGQLHVRQSYSSRSVACGQSGHDWGHGVHTPQQPFESYCGRDRPY